MKKTIISSMTSIVFFTSLVSATQISKKQKIDWIRTHFYTIEKEIPRYKKKSVMLNEFESCTCYADGAFIAKIEVYAEQKTSYYFHKNKLFFTFIENAWNKDTGGVKKPYREERIYIYNDTIIDALLKETDQDSFKNVPNRPHTKFLSYSLKEKDSFLLHAYSALQACQQGSR